jgi:hypothetical protein
MCIPIQLAPAQNRGFIALQPKFSFDFRRSEPLLDQRCSRSLGEVVILRKELWNVLRSENNAGKTREANKKHGTIWYHLVPVLRKNQKRFEYEIKRVCTKNFIPSIVRKAAGENDCLADMIGILLRNSFVNQKVPRGTKTCREFSAART